MARTFITLKDFATGQQYKLKVVEDPDQPDVYLPVHSLEGVTLDLSSVDQGEPNSDNKAWPTKIISGLAGLATDAKGEEIRSAVASVFSGVGSSNTLLGAIGSVLGNILTALAALTNGAQAAQLLTGVKGSTVAGGVTSQNVDANTQALHVVTKAPTTAVGAAASGAALSGAPVLMGGSDGTNARTIGVTAAGELSIQATAAVGAANPAKAIALGGSDGTLLRLLKTLTDGTLFVTASAPSSGGFNFHLSLNAVTQLASHVSKNGFYVRVPAGGGDVRSGYASDAATTGYLIPAGGEHYFEDGNTNLIWLWPSTGTIIVDVIGN